MVRKHIANSDPVLRRDLTSFLDPRLDPRFEWLFVKQTSYGILHQTKQWVIDIAWSSVHSLSYFRYEFIK